MIRLAILTTVATLLASSAVAAGKSAEDVSNEITAACHGYDLPVAGDFTALDYVCWLNAEVYDKIRNAKGEGMRLDQVNTRQSDMLIRGPGISRYIAETAGLGLERNRLLERGSWVNRASQPVTETFTDSDVTYLVKGPDYTPCTSGYLYSSDEYGYWVQWCEDTAMTAQKDYFYLFANGGAAFLFGFEFECNTSDEVAMPGPVRGAVCFP